MKNVISTLDFNDFLSITKRRGFVTGLEVSLRTTGFFFLKNHLIDVKLLGEARQLFTKFFDSSEELRLRYAFPEEFYQRGYTPLRTEAGEFANLTPDEKHFFQVGADRNVEIPEIIGFDQMCQKLFYQFNQNYLLLLQAIAESVELYTNYFDEKAGNSIFRAIDYPPTPNPLVDDEAATKGGNIIGMCATKHTDINMLTLLFALESGLQLWYENDWLPITNDPDLIIVNCGDMLEHLTNGIYRSGLHRVVCERNIRRFSIPFFGHLSPSESLVPLRHLGEPDLTRFPHATAGQFLLHRLEQIGLK